MDLDLELSVSVYDDVNMRIVVPFFFNQPGFHEMAQVVLNT